MLRPRGYVPLLPVLACPNLERRRVAMEIATQHRDVRRVFAFIMNVLQMSDDAPHAPQPPALSIPLQPHQLQNVARMIEQEHTTFRSVMYTPIPVVGNAESAENVIYIDPISRSVPSNQLTMSTGASGGFLCDDVGLGKTLSVIAVCVANPPGPHVGVSATLVVCTPSIIGQWALEISTRAPSLRTVIYHGKHRPGVTSDDIAAADIVLTTYTTYLQHVDQLRPIRWTRVVFDESHTMSDRFSHQAPTASRRWCITATPFNNIYRQLRSLHLYARPYDFGVGTMYFVLHPIMIRHSKDQTDITLPPISEALVPVRFDTAAESSLYDRTYDRILKELRVTPQRHYALKLRFFAHVLRMICTGGEWSLGSLLRGHVPSVHGTRAPDFSLVAPHGNDGEDCPICMNAYDQPTMTTCNHWFCSDCIATALVRTGAKCPMCRRPQQQSQLRLGVLPGQLPGVEDPLADGDVRCDSKTTKLIDMLHALRADDATSKSLVFCPTSATIPDLMRCLKANGFKARCIHGGMPALDRGGAIRAFQADPATTVFVLSVRSAAAGVNLTAANHVIFMGPGMNRAAEHQAIGRAHRFGQRRPVTVHHLYMHGTIEESLHKAIRDRRIGPTWSVEVLDRVLRNEC